MTLIYGIGAQKAGTSWLFDQLQASTDVHGGYVKEMHYFDTLHMPSDQNHSMQRLTTLKTLADKIKPGFSPENATRLRQIRQVTHQLACFAGPKGDHKAYIKALMEGRKKERALLDCTPSYSGLNADGFRDMASVGNSKFIFILRDPISRMWSQIRMRTEMLKTAKTDQEFMQISVDHARHLHEINRYPNIFRADYMRTMADLEEAIPAQDIKYIFYEELFRQETMDDICAFLNVAPVKVEADKQVNLGRPIRIDAETRALIGNALRVQYDGVFEKFGDAVPAKWHKILAKVDQYNGGAPVSPPTPAQEATSPIKRKVRGLMSRLKPADTDPSGRPVVFLHIPKTAGQTISKQVRYKIGTRNVSPILTHSQASAEEQFPPNYRYYGGHLDWTALQDCLPDCFSFSVLRDPKERIASLYFFLQREAQAMSPAELEQPANTGKRYLMNVSADDYFFPEDMQMKSFVADGYFNKYCYYFASRMMRGWSALKKADEDEVFRMAQCGASEVNKIYGMAQLDILESDLSTLLNTQLSFQGSGTNVGPKPQTGSRWGDLCALFEKDESLGKLERFIELDLRLIQALDLESGPALGRSYRNS